MSQHPTTTLHLNRYTQPRSSQSNATATEPDSEMLLDQFARWLRDERTQGQATADTIRAYTLDAREHLQWLHDQQLTAVHTNEAVLQRYSTWLREKYGASTTQRFMHFISNSERFRLDPSFFDFRAKDDILSVSDPLPTMGRILSAAPLLLDKEMRRLIRR